MDDKKLRFLPFHAVNGFMLPEYRLEVIEKVLDNLEKVSNDQRGALVGQIKRNVAVPGFRNSAMAPLPLKIKGAVTAFEKNPEFAARIMAAWFSLYPELAEQVDTLLKSRGWELLPVDADRTQLPGFMVTWPKADSFEVLSKAFKEAHADSPASENDISLMVVWLSGRLPYEVVEDVKAAG